MLRAMEDDMFVFATRRLAGALWATAAVAALAAPLGAVAQTYPTRPVQVIVPYPPGGLTDGIVRQVAQGLTEKWKTTVFIENKGGGGTTIGTAYVARAAADGQTLLFTSTGYVTNQVLMKSLPYSADAFTPIAMGATAPNVLYVHPSVPATNLAELLTYARANPGALKFASTGHGSSPHLTAELFASKTGISMVHVPYKGAGPALADLLAGHVNAMFHFPASLALAKEGKLKAIAVASTDKLKEAPGLPTFIDSGVPDVVSSSWFGFFAPAATPQPVKDKLHKDIADVLASARLRAFMEESGLTETPMTQAEFATFITNEQDKWATVIRERKIPIE